MKLVLLLLLLLSPSLVWAVDDAPRYKLVPELGGWWSSTVPDLTSAGTITGTTVAATDLDCTTFLNGGVVSTDTGGNFVCQNDDTGGSSAPADATYVTLSTNATLTDERVFTYGLAIDSTDAGAGSTLTVAFDPVELTGSRTFGDASTDTIVWTWDRNSGTDPTITFGSQTVTGQIVAASTAVQLGVDHITDFTGSGLSVVGGALTSSGGGNSFETVAVPAGASVVAESSTDTLTLTEDTFLTITGTAATDTIAFTQVTTDLGTDGLIAANAVALGTDTTNAYVATVADAGNTTIAVVGSGGETAAVTLDAIDLNCTNCIGDTEVSTGAGTALSDDLEEDAHCTEHESATSGTDCSTEVLVWDPTEFSTITLGAGAFTTMTFDAGATDPVITAASATLTIAPGGSNLIVSDDVDIQQATPCVILRPTSGDAFEICANDSQLTVSNLTDTTQIVHVDAGNDLNYIKGNKHVTCKTYENLVAADDNMLFLDYPEAITIKEVSCRISGFTTLPTLGLEDDLGNAMTGAPVCGINGDFTPITAGNILIRSEALRVDVSNTPVPGTGTQAVICVCYLENE